MHSIRYDQQALDAKEIQPRLEELLEAAPNFLERQWPSRYQSVEQARILFYTRMRLARNTYDAFMWIVADSPSDPRRKLLVLSAAPLVRSLFEELVAVIFLFQDVPSLVPALVITGYTELWKEHEHAVKYHSSDEEWNEYIAGMKSRLAQMAKELKLSNKQAALPTSRWPTPGKTVGAMKKMYKNSPALPFLEYLNSWMYRKLSADSHLSYTGLLRRGSFFAKNDLQAGFGKERYKEMYKNEYDSYRMEMLWTAFTLALAIVSEIEGHFRYGMNEKAKYLWTMFERHSDLAKEFYDRRYRNLLGGS